MYNSSSDKMLLEIINFYNELENTFPFVKIEIDWYYQADDEDSKGWGLEIKSLFSTKVNVLECQQINLELN